MSDRKQTPDVLADLLGGEPPASDIEFAAPPRKPVGRPKKPAQPKAIPAEGAEPKAARAEKPAAPKHTAPTAWEYRVVSFQEHGGWRVRFIDGQPVKNWAESLTLVEYNAMMGEEGWELAGACSGTPLYGRSDTYQLFYKRPKA